MTDPFHGSIRVLNIAGEAGGGGGGGGGAGGGGVAGGGSDGGTADEQTEKEGGKNQGGWGTCNETPLEDKWTQFIKKEYVSSSPGSSPSRASLPGSTYTKPAHLGLAAGGGSGSGARGNGAGAAGVGGVGGQEGKWLRPKHRRRDASELPCFVCVRLLTGVRESE